MLEDMKICKIIIAESYEDLNKDYDEVPLKIKKICSTRWTMRHMGFIRIKDNYKALLRLQDKIQEKERAGLDNKTKIRIAGVSSKMKIFDFLFHLELAIIVYSQTGTLSQMLQHKTMTLLEGKNFAKGTVKCLKDL